MYHLLHLFALTGIDEGANLGIRILTIAQFQLRHMRADTFDKISVNILVYQKALRRHTNLATIAGFGQSRAFGHRFKIYIGKNQTGCIATQFQREFGIGAGGAFQQKFAYPGTAYKVDFAHFRTRQQRFAYFGGIAQDQICYTSRDARRYQQFHQGHGREGGVFAGFGHNGTASGQGSRPYPTEVPNRKIPGSDDAHHPNGLGNDRHPFVVATSGNDPPIIAFGFFGVPLKKLSSDHPFADGLGHGFSRFGHRDLRQFFALCAHQVCHFFQDVGALPRVGIFPNRKSGLGDINC